MQPLIDGANLPTGSVPTGPGRPDDHARGDCHLRLFQGVFNGVHRGPHCGCVCVCILSSQAYREVCHDQH